MKKTLALSLALIMVLSVLAPIKANAEEVPEEISVRTPEEKAEELFNKSVQYFEPFKEFDESEITEFVTPEVFSSLFYDFFVEEINKYEDLSAKLGDGSELKASIDALVTEDNVSTLLKELKTGEAVESLTILGSFISSVEELFEEDWDNIVDDEFRKSAREIVKEVAETVEATLETQLTDIENHWAKDEIQALIGLGIVDGYLDGTFKPDNKISRAEFSKMIVVALELEMEVYDGGFTDVSMDKWHANYVATMVKHGLASGYTDGTFGPDGNIIRNEMAAILARVLNEEVSPEEQEALLSSYEDRADIPEWAEDAVEEVAKAELMKGDTNNNFNGSNTATRAEAAVVIYRLINR